MTDRSRTPLFLIELTIMLLVFSIFAAVCLRMFAAARQTSTGAGDLGNAVTWSQSAADCFRAAGGDAGLAAQYLNAGQTGSGLYLGFDADWRPSGLSPAAYELELTVTGATTAEITVRKADGESLYTLNTEVLGYGSR